MYFIGNFYNYVTKEIPTYIYSYIPIIILLLLLLSIHRQRLGIHCNSAAINPIGTLKSWYESIIPNQEEGLASLAASHT